MRLFALSFAIVAIASCTTELDAGRPAGRHLPDAQALEVGSCLAACGGLSDDGCWCDDACEEFGDCCADFIEQCTITDDTEPCFLPQCAAGTTPEDSDGDGCLDTCVLRCDVWIKCANGYTSTDTDGNGCADQCVPNEPPPPCTTDDECGAGEHCQVIYCFAAPCPPAQCVPNDEPVNPPSDEACSDDAECPNGYCESFMSCLALNCPPPPPNECVVPTGCGDGSELLCAMVEPQCAGGTTAAVVGHCWQCVDARDCVVQPAPPAPPADDSCVDCCGDEAPSGCWCDANCGFFEDCCADIDAQCGA